MFRGRPALQIVAALVVAHVAAIALAQAPAGTPRRPSPEVEALNPPVPPGLVVSEERRVPAEKKAAGYKDPAFYPRFEEQVRETKRKLLELLTGLKRAGKRIAGYGAPGKGNTLLNYCGVRTDFLDFTVDKNPYKQGRFLPGTHIPCFPPDKIDAEKPDYIFILPWNLKDEIMKQLAHTRAWGAQFIVPIPEPQIL